MNANLDSPRAESGSGKIGFRLRIALMVGFFAWFLYDVVDLRLVFESRNILFLWNRRFFTDFIGQPGSLLNWADSLFVQLCYRGWPAVLALAVLAALLLVSTAGFMNATARAPVSGTWLLPSLGLFALYGGYYSNTSLLLGSALALTAANAWARLPAVGTGLTAGVFVALSMGVYYLGGEAYYCFAACCLVHAALTKKSWRLTLGLFLAGILVKFGLDAALARFHLATHNFHWSTLEGVSLDPWRAALFYGYFPLCAAAVNFRQSAGNAATRLGQRLRAFLGKTESRKPRKGKVRKPASSPEQAPVPAREWSWIRWTAGTALMLLLAGTIGYRSVDWDVKAFLEINYCAEHELWDQLLARARSLRSYTPYTSHDVDLALYHKGRLPYEMFSYPQTHGVFSILLKQNQVPLNAVMLRKPCDLMLELGRINESEHIALEMLEIRPTGSTLRRLAMIKMTKAQPAAARIFLNILRDDLIWGTWAKECLRHLETRPDLAGDEEIQQARRLMLPRDDLAEVCEISADEGVRVDYAVSLLNLLKHNPRNRMAFEYLMAIWLLQGNLQEVVDLLPRTADFSYPVTPPYYEEAALLYASSHPGEVKEDASGIFFRGRRISDVTAEKNSRFWKLVERVGGSAEKAAPDVARELPGSYYAYYLAQLTRRNE